ncbi:MAG: NAD(P)-binding protein [Myxococcota bacterium]
MTRVAIIGAGLAGIRVAHRLAAAGADVRIFEKARGVGGRMSTRRTDFGAFDHGAQFFTAEDPRFRRQVGEWIERGVASRWTGRVVHLDAGSVTADDDGVERFVGRPRMNLVARDLLGSVPTEFGVRIEKVRRGDDGWTLSCDAGFAHEGFDLVVVAVPPAQAAPLVERSSALSTAIAGARMWPCHATMLGFATPLDVAFDGAFVESESIAWVARNDSKPERDKPTCWVVHSRPEWSDRCIEAEPARVGADLEAEFGRVMGVSLPPVEYRATHRWLYSRPANALGSAALFDAEVGLAVCGDWLRGDSVEDAYVSAEDLADVLLPAYGLA